VAGSSWRDHEGMPKRLTMLAYALFGFAVVLAGVAVVEALVLGLDREAAWSNFLITNTAIGLSAAPCGLLIARAKPDNPIGWLFLIAGIAPLLTAAVTPFLIYGAAHDWPQLAAVAGHGLLVFLVLGRFLLPSIDLAALSNREAAEPPLGRTVLADRRERASRQHVRRSDAGVRRIVIPRCAVVGNDGPHSVRHD
jgi:hypothetical protein